MRKVLLAVTVLFVACIQAARADVNPNAAPADEYFGPYKQSVLEIRNRLSDYDQRDVSTMLDPSVPTYLDHLQLAIRDWQSKYPRDPWLASALAHLVREYWRAGQASSMRGMAALADLRSAFPDAPVTSETVALVYGSNGALAQVSRDGRHAGRKRRQRASSVGVAVVCDSRRLGASRRPCSGSPPRRTDGSRCAAARGSAARESSATG